MKEVKNYIVISRHNNDVPWADEYGLDYIPIDSVSGHEATMLTYIYNNYENLPEVTVFLQDKPFDHIHGDDLRRLINNTKLTLLDSDMVNHNSSYYKKSPVTEGYGEINNSWYISAHNNRFGISCKYNSFDEFMNAYFKNYEHIEILTFSPGTQYVVPKKNILYYSREFWKNLMEELPVYNMTIAHIIERAMAYIFADVFEER